LTGIANESYRPPPPLSNGPYATPKICLSVKR
jgi:hypothetical protein